MGSLGLFFIYLLLKCAPDLEKLGLLIPIKNGKMGNSGVRARFESLLSDLIIISLNNELF